MEAGLIIKPLIAYLVTIFLGYSLNTALTVGIALGQKGIKIIHAARHVNPDIAIVANVRYLAEKPALEELKVEYICSENEALQAFKSLVTEIFNPAYP